MARAASSRPRFERSFRVRLDLAREPKRTPQAPCNSTGERPRLDPGKSVKTTVEARPASSATKPSASLSAASATIATHGPERSGVKREIAQDGADVERHMRAVHDDGQASRPNFDVEALHAPGETRGGARVAVEERRADRLPGAPAHPLAAKLAEDGGGEREIDLFDRRRGVEARALHPRAELVGSGLQDAAGFVIGVKRRDEHGPGLEDPDLLAARSPRACCPRFPYARARCW